MKKQPIPDVLAAFDKSMVEIEEDFNNPELLGQATEKELQACLDMADKIHAAVSRFKITVVIILNSLKEEL